MKPITSLKSISKGRSDVHHLDPRRLSDWAGLNERIDYGPDFTELKDDIALRGVTEPFKVKLIDGEVRIIKGYRRIRAVRELIAEKRWTHGTVPVLPEERGATMTDRLVDQITGNLGKSYTVLEQGRVFTRLLGEGNTIPEIAQRTHKTRTHINNAIALAAAPAEVLKFVEQGKIADSLVIDLIRDAAGDNEKLLAEVKAAIETAKSAGKDHATRKHTKEGQSRKAKVENSDSGSTGSLPVGSESLSEQSSSTSEVTAEDEALYEKCIAIIRDTKLASIQHFQQRLSLEPATATRLVKLMQERGILAAVSPIEDLGQPIPILMDLTPGVPIEQVPTHRMDWSSVDSNAGGSGGGGSDRTSYDTSTNLGKLNKILEELPAEECDPINRAAVEATINFLEGKTTVKEFKSFLRL